MRRIVFKALSSGLKAIGIFVILRSLDGFESDCPETKFQTITCYSQFEKVIVQKSIVVQMIKYQLSPTRSIKLMIINMTYACIICYPLTYQYKQLIKKLSSCLRKLDGCFFVKINELRQTMWLIQCFSTGQSLLKKIEKI